VNGDVVLQVERVCVCSTLTTPVEETWPGVSELPDYKPTFPNWKQNTLHQSVKQLDNVGLDLLEKTLIYDPAKRISAKALLVHPYFDDLDKSTLPASTVL
jgi:cyclin-dependent kinase 1